MSNFPVPVRSSQQISPALVANGRFRVINIRKRKYSYLRALIIVPVLAYSAGTAFAQSDSENCDVLESQADEYILFTSYFNDSKRRYKIAHLDSFVVRLNESEDEIGYVVVYSTGSRNEAIAVKQEAIAMKELEWIRAYLLPKNRLRSSRFRIIYGGIANKAKSDFYIQPKDVRPPMPFRATGRREKYFSFPGRRIPQKRAKLLPPEREISPNFVATIASGETEIVSRKTLTPSSVMKSSGAKL